jgi:hypothetical protein
MDKETNDNVLHAPKDNKNKLVNEEIRNDTNDDDGGRGNEHKEDVLERSVWTIAENIINDHQCMLEKIKIFDQKAVDYMADRIQRGLPIRIESEYDKEWSPMQLNRKAFQKEPMCDTASAVSDEFLVHLSHALNSRELTIVEYENLRNAEETITTITIAKKYMQIYTVYLTMNIWWSRKTMRFLYDRIQVYHGNSFFCGGKIDQTSFQFYDPKIGASRATSQDTYSTPFDE